ncbi:hypothetical protein [Streptomyces sp. NPDC058457]|uniref:hypothetical protein n=1 Tax=Streptomyces sp. NPDC058457 TaxID=3346507 RepID=UPI0036661075
MTARKPARSGPAKPDPARKAQEAQEATAGIPNTPEAPAGDQPVPVQLSPEPLSPEAWQRLCDRLVRKYH